MKELKDRIGNIFPGEKRWYQHVADCLAAGLCPNCGNSLYIDAGVMDKKLGEVTFFECPICQWEGYTE